MKKSRLLYVVDDWSVNSGPNCQLRQLIDWVPKDEFEIQVVSFGKPQQHNDLQPAGTRLSCIDANNTVVTRLLKLREIFHDFAPDIIHAWGYPVHLPVACCHYKNAQLAKTKLIYSYFGAPPRRLMVRRWFEEYTSRQAVITVAHQCIGQRLVEDGMDNPYQIVPNAFVQTESDKKSARQRLMDLAGLSDRNIFLAGTVSANEPRHRLKDQIWAADVIFCVRPDVHLLIVGYGSGQKALQHFLGKTEATGQVHFVNASEFSVADLAGLDAYWNSQLIDANPIMMLTAMSMNVPAISVLSDATADVILPMRSGFGTTFGARDEFARWTKYLIEQRRSDQIAAQGREHVEKNFPVQLMVDGYMEIYQPTNLSK